MIKIEKKAVKNCTLTIKLTEDERDTLKALADESGITLSNLGHQILKAGYKKLTKKDL